MAAETSMRPGRQRLRALVLFFGTTAAALTMLALLGSISMRAVAAPATTANDSPETMSSTFGDAVPTEKFVHEFQRQVVQQLQSTLSQASRDQNERLQRFEKQQNQRLQEQAEALQRSLDNLQSRLSQRSTVDSSDAPRVNSRKYRDEPLSVSALSPMSSTAAEVSNSVDRPDSSRIASRVGSANLSPHGFVEGRLLNGVVAIVGGTERESIVALTGGYQAANGFVTDLDGCFALVQGRPELPAGRIDFKVSRLTCNFPDGASKTWDVSGWLVDLDGIRGVRAQIVQNAGKKALVAAAGGALSGFGRRLSQQQYQVSTGPLVSSSTFIGNATHDMLGGSGEGAANALEQSVSDYYNLYAPSLQVGGGTRVSLVIANELKFPSNGRLFTQTYSVTP